jgi:hypothetical protein
MNRMRILFLLLATSVTVWACSSTQDDWNKANAANTVAAYQQFLSNHPTGDRSVEATGRIRALQDENAWTRAKQTNSSSAYQGYLQNQPTGSHVKEAQEAVTAVQRAADWQAAQTAGTAASIQDFLKKYPQGSEADQARTRLTTMTGYRVQLAAAKTQKQADKERDQLRAKYSSILHDVVVAPPSSGTTYQLESAPMSQSDANSACEQLKRAHRHCEVVKS